MHVSGIAYIYIYIYVCVFVCVLGSQKANLWVCFVRKSVYLGLAV